jgi:hypothetical protein
MGCPTCHKRTQFMRGTHSLRGLSGGSSWREFGQGLRARYQIPKELPPKLLALLVKLDAAEGNYLFRYAPPLERRSVDESDWLPPRFVWQNDVDLFGG